MARTWNWTWMLPCAVLGACAVEASVTEERGVAEARGAAFAAQAVDAAAPAPRRGGASNEPVDYDDPALECFQFRAHAAPDRRQDKYSVPTTPDLYVGFTVKAPWKGTRYIKSIRSLVDNAKVVHHWQLYRNLNGGTEAVTPAQNALHPNAELLYGFAPGTNDLYFDADVGMIVPDGSVFQLENHYNNRTGAPAPDASGVELCVTPTKPEHVAALAFVGSIDIRGTSAKGTCTHESKEPVHLIMGFPHMHVKGTHMKVDWTKPDGTVRTVHDGAFDFNYQRTYILDDVVLAPGDKLTTTCTYSAPARVGTGTNDEMCYFFSVHWPAGALSRKNLFTLTQGPNTCMD